MVRVKVAQGAIRHNLALLTVAPLWLIWSGVASSQELEPRSYVNLPVGLNFLVLGYGHTEGSVAPSPSAPIDNAFLKTDVLALGYARTFALLGDSAKVDIGTFRSCYEGRADINEQPVDVSRCEWGDTRMRLTWNFVGAPALRPQEYRKTYKPGFTLGASLQVEAPTGDYRSDRVVNAGTNRWMVRPGLGFSYIWEGWYFDVGADVKFFTDNSNYLGERLTQEPLFQLQAHLVRYFAPGAWFGINSNYYSGGESTRGRVDLKDGLDNARFGVTVSFPVAQNHSLRFNASTGVVTRLGTDFDTLGITYQYRF
jgi:hypothetical protein